MIIQNQAKLMKINLENIALFFILVLKDFGAVFLVACKGSFDL